MARPQTYDIAWTRGTTPKLVMRFTRNGVAIPFSDARMSVSDGKKILFRLTIENNAGITHTNPETGEIKIQPTAEQTRLLLPTRSDGIPRNRYEMELRNDTDGEFVPVMGTIDGIGGDNDDEEEPS